MGLHITNFWLTIPIFFISTLVINYFSDKLGDALCKVGKKLHIPNDVRGATFDSISSSLPELITALIAVLIYGRFEEIGFATIAGSGIFNILVIPMFAILVYKGFKSNSISVDRPVVVRDMFYYIGSLSILFISYLLGVLNVWTGIALLAWYGLYIFKLYRQTKQFRLREKHENVPDSYLKLFIISLISVAFIYVCIDAVVHAAIVFSNHLQIPQFIVSLIILAGCTSIPDTFLSIRSSKEGDLEGSLANAVGSNIFDICVCLGVPIIIYGQAMQVDLVSNLPLFAFLVGSMVVTGTTLLKKEIKKTDSLFMALFYIFFLVTMILMTFQMKGAA